MSTQPIDENTLEHLQVLRAQMGDGEAFTQLFKRYNPRLLYYVRRLVGHTHDAEDVLQDVWTTVVKKIVTLEQPAAFRNWIYRIAHNQAISRLRRMNREVPLDEIPNEHKPMVVPEDDDESNVWLAGFDVAEVHAALDQLSPTHCEALTLRFLEGLSYEELAAVVGCTVGTVRSRIHYAKKTLRTHMETKSNKDPGQGKKGTKP